MGLPDPFGRHLLNVTAPLGILEDYKCSGIYYEYQRDAYMQAGMRLATGTTSGRDEAQCCGVTLRHVMRLLKHWKEEARWR